MFWKRKRTEGRTEEIYNTLKLFEKTLRECIDEDNTIRIPKSYILTYRLMYKMGYLKKNKFERNQLRDQILSMIEADGYQSTMYFWEGYESM